MLLCFFIPLISTYICMYVCIYIYIYIYILYIKLQNLLNNVYVYMQEILIENINCKCRSYLNCIGLLFQVVLHCFGIPIFVFFMCVTLSQTSVLLSRAGVSFCLILPATCSRFCQFDVLSACHWSVTQPSLLFKY